MRRNAMRPKAALFISLTVTVAAWSGGSAQDEPDTAFVPMYKGTPGRTGEMVGPAPLPPVGTLWSLPTPGQVKSNPAVAGKTVVIVGGDTHVLALDPATGEQRWASADAGYVGSPAVSGDHAYVAREDGAMTALSLLDGAVRWSTPSMLGFLTAPLIVNDLVIAGGTDGRLLAFDAMTGDERWASQLGGEVTSRGPATDGQRVFVGASDAYLDAVDLATGDVAWSWPFPASCCATVAVRDGLVVASGEGDESGLLVALDAETGTERWRFVPEDGSGLRAPSMDATSVYVKAADGTMVALASTDGSVQWTAAVEPHESPIVIVDGDLLVVGPADTVTQVDKATGALGWTASFSGDVTGGISVAGGRVLAGTSDGQIMALGQVDSGVPPPSAAPDGVTEATIVRALEAPGGFSKPVDVAFDADGNGWVTEGSAGTIAIFSPHGDFIERWGTPGRADGELNFTVPGSNDPTGAIVFLPDGGFWITDPGNYRIQRFDAERQWVQSVGHFGDGDGQFMGQTQMSRSDDGRLFVQDGERNDIQIFDAEGAHLGVISSMGAGGDPLVDPVASLVVGDRLLFVDGAPRWDTVVAMSLDGELLGTLTAPGYKDLADLSLAPDGTVIAADWGGLVHAFDPATLEALGSWRVSHDGSPTLVDGLGVAPDGTVWAAEWSISAVEMLDLP